MLSKVAGFNEIARIMDEKKLDAIQGEAHLKISKICAEDMFVKSSGKESNLKHFLDPKEMEDARKLLKKPTGEEFDKIFKHECDILKNKG